MPIIENKDIINANVDQLLKPFADMLDLLDKKANTFKASMSSLEQTIAKVVKTGSGAEAKALTENINKLKKETESLTAVQKAELQIKNQLKTVEAKLVASFSDEAEQLRHVKLETQALNKAQNESAKLASQMVGAYQKLSIQYTQAALKAKNLAAEYGSNSKQAKQAAANANKLGNELKKIDASVGQHTRNVGNYTSVWKKLGSQMLAFTGITTAVYSFISVVKNAFATIREFSSKLSELKAITGATGKDLDYLRDRAKELGKEYGKSASEIVEAMKLVGSAKPELLGNVKALGDMTEAVLTLSKASGMDLAQTTSSLSVIMNQFGLSASKANDVINVLAAGSKFGSVEVDYLAEAISKVGTVAATANLSLEQVTAVMELFGEKGIRAETAGNGFKKVLITLQKDTNNYTNGVFDLNKAIDNNIGISDDNIALQKKFGAEFFTVAQILLQNKDRFNELSESVTGTNTAFEQAAIQMDNLSGDLDKASGAWDNFILSIESGEGNLSKVIRTIIQLSTKLLNLISIVGKINTSSGKLELAKFVGGDEKIARELSIQKQVLEKLNDEQTRSIYIRDRLVKLTTNMKLAEMELSKEENKKTSISGEKKKVTLSLQLEIYRQLIGQLNEYKDANSATSDVIEETTTTDEKKTKGLQDQAKATKELAEQEKIRAELKSDLASIKTLDDKEITSEITPTTERDISGEITGQMATQAELQAVQDAESLKRGLYQETTQLMSDEYDKRIEKAIEAGNEQLAQELRVQQILSETFNLAGQQLGELAASGELTMHDLLTTMIDVVERMIQLVLAQLLANQIATKGFAGLITYGILSGIIKGFFAGVKAQVQNFATGTDYVDGPGTETSDSIPARLSKGERIVPASINKQMLGITNKDLPKIVNAGMNSLRMEIILNEIKQNSQLTASYLSNGKNIWQDETGKWINIEDWRTGSRNKYPKK